MIWSLALPLAQTHPLKEDVELPQLLRHWILAGRNHVDFVFQERTLGFSQTLRRTVASSPAAAAGWTAGSRPLTQLWSSILTSDLCVGSDSQQFFWWQNHHVPIKENQESKLSVWLCFHHADVQAGAAQAGCGGQACSRELRGRSVLSTVSRTSVSCQVWTRCLVSVSWVMARSSGSALWIILPLVLHLVGNSIMNWWEGRWSSQLPNLSSFSN